VICPHCTRLPECLRVAPVNCASYICEFDIALHTAENGGDTRRDGQV